MTDLFVTRYLGIDFGTSNSVMSYMDYRKEDGKLVPNAANPTMVMFEQCNSYVPTLIMEPGNGKEGTKNDIWLYGWEAENLYNSYFQNLLRSEFKMDLLDPKKRDKAINLTNLFISYMLSKYSDSFSTVQNTTIESTNVYVSYPVKWPYDLKEITIKATKEAVKKANIKNASVKGMDEPSAAMQYWLSTNTKEIGKIRDNIGIGDKINVMLLDMGAGTTDIVVFKWTIGSDSAHEILATYPPVDGKSFGGREVDDILKNYFKNYFKERKIAISYGKHNNVESESKLKTDIRRWKETTLSKYLSKNLPVKSEDYPTKLVTLCESLGIELEDFDRKKLEKVLGEYSYLNQFPPLVKQAIEETNELTEDDIDLIICTGGHSQWYFVEEMLKGNKVECVDEKINLGKLKTDPWRLCKMQRPQETVARGLSLQGMPLNIRKRSANGVWLNIKCGDSLNTVKIMDKGVLLPLNVTKSFSISGSREYSEDIDLTIKPMVGSTLRSAIPQLEINKKIEVGILKRIWELIDSLISNNKSSKSANLNFKMDNFFDEDDIWSAQGEISCEEAKTGIFNIKSGIK